MRRFPYLSRVQVSSCAISPIFRLQATVMSILLYGCTTGTMTKRMEKKLDGNYARMLRAILNKSSRQQPTKQQLYGHLPPITKTIQVRQTRHAGHWWRSGDELISDVLLWTPSHGRAKAGQPAQTYIQQLCADTGCRLEDIPGTMDNKDGWRERVREIHAGGAIWWWWWWWWSLHLFFPHFCILGLVDLLFFLTLVLLTVAFLCFTYSSTLWTVASTQSFPLSPWHV